MSTLALASEFPAATREAWLAAVETALKGADFRKALVRRSYDGLTIEPLYSRADAPGPSLGRIAVPWRIVQRLDHPDPAQANALALQDLEGGADALSIIHAGAPTARGFGLEAAGVEELDRALAGVMLDLIRIRVETAPFEGRTVAARWRELVERRRSDPAALRIDFGLDPVGDFARTGRTPLPWPDLWSRFAESAAGLGPFGGTAARIDTRAYHEAGAGEAQELAAALATGVAYLRALEGGGRSPEEGRQMLSFLLVADADEFLTVAKFRAFRRLWAQVEAACGLAPQPAGVEAETAWRMMTRRDPWVNILRTTLATFSAAVGGADAISVLPFTAALGLPDGFARRLARNTQHVLLEESNLWRVADPVAGSGAFEALTQALAEEAWSRFQEIEREGGIVASLGAGLLQARIAAVRAERERAAATRRDPLTGTSEFPHLAEAPVTVLMPSPRAGGERSSEAKPRAGEAPRHAPPDPVAPSSSPARSDERLDLSSPAGRGASSCEPLPSRRLAEPYEALRDRSDAILAETGERPRVFLANLGPIAAFSARATFARNAFEAVGIEAVTNDGFPSHAAMLEAFRASGARLACLCSSDAIYESEAVSAASALRQAGAETLFLAGRAGEREAAYRQAGVTGFLAMGSDLPAALGEFVRSAAQPSATGTV